MTPFRLRFAWPPTRPIGPNPCASYVIGPAAKWREKRDVSVCVRVCRGGMAATWWEIKCVQLSTVMQKLAMQDWDRVGPLAHATAHELCFLRAYRGLLRLQVRGATQAFHGTVVSATLPSLPPRSKGAFCVGPMEWVRGCDQWSLAHAPLADQEPHPRAPEVVRRREPRAGDGSAPRCLEYLLNCIEAHRHLATY